ncbi:hypothetical protein OK016_18165 [Vibrio chagasii]|nr:hypothetical protein [Vibrio chagasii]
MLLILIKATISHGRHVTYSSQHILLNYIKNGIGESMNDSYLRNAVR